MIKTLMCAMLCSFAALATPITSVTLADVPPSSPILGVPGLYVSPYTLSINGTNVAGLCIDFDDPADVGQTWNAYLSVDGGDISKTYHPDRAIAYQQEAYIYTQITKPGISAQEQTNWQEAAWLIMNATYGLGNPTYGPSATALQYLMQAQSNASSVDPMRFVVVSSSDPQLVTQEFLAPASSPAFAGIPMVVHVAVPEPASCALLGSGLLIAGLLRFIKRTKTE